MRRRFEDLKFAPLLFSVLVILVSIIIYCVVSKIMNFIRLLKIIFYAFKVFC